MKDENSKWMNRNMYFDIFLNEALVYTLGSLMMKVKVLHECQSQNTVHTSNTQRYSHLTLETR